MKKNLWILLVLVLLVVLTGSTAVATEEEITCQQPENHRDCWTYSGTSSEHTVTCTECGASWTCHSESLSCEASWDENVSENHQLVCRWCGFKTGEIEPHVCSCQDDPLVGDTRCVFCGVSVANGAVIGRKTHTYNGFSRNEQEHWMECTGCGESNNRSNHMDFSGDGLCDSCGYPMVPQKTCENKTEHQSQWEYSGDLWESHSVYCPSCDISWTCLSQGCPDQPIYEKDGQSLYHHAVCSECGMASEKKYEHECSCTGDPDTCCWCGLTTDNGAVIAGAAHQNVDWNQYQRDMYGHWHVCQDCGEKINFGSHWEDASEGKADGLCDVCGYPMVSQETCKNKTEHQSQWKYSGDIDESHSVYCPSCDLSWTCLSQGCPDQPIYEKDGQSLYHHAVCSECGMASVKKYEHECSCTGDPDTCCWCGLTTDNGAVIAGAAHQDVDWDHYQGDMYGHWHVCQDCGEKINFESHREDTSEAEADGLCDDCGLPFLEFPCSNPMEHHDIWVYTDEGDCHTVYCPECDWWEAECGCIDTISAAVWETDGSSLTHQTICTRCGFPHADTKETHFRPCYENTDACAICGITKNDGAVIELSHETEYDWLPSENGLYHYHLCMYYEHQFDTEPHKDEDNDGFCDLCYDKIIPCEHPNIGDVPPQKNAEKHWYICPDCFAEVGHESHIADDETSWSVLDITHHIAACAVCGYPGSVIGECADPDKDGYCDTCGQSMDASGITLVPKERLHLHLPEGMVVTDTVIEDGLIEVTIDDDKTDWQRVVTTTVGLGTTDITLSTSVDRPEDYIKLITTQCADTELVNVPDNEAIKMFREQESYNQYHRFGDNYFRSNGAFYFDYAHGTYEPLENKLTPTYNGDPYACFLCWYDENKNVRKMEKYQLRYHHTKNRQYTVYPPAISEDRIELTQDTVNDYDSWTYKNGIMHLIGTKSRAMHEDGHYRANFLIQAPSSTATYCETLLQGNVEVENGQIEFGVGGDAGTAALSLLWYDDNDQLIAYELLTIEIEIVDEGYGPQYYQSDIYCPVPEAGMDIRIAGDHQVTNWKYQVASASSDNDRGVVRYSYGNQLTGLSDLEKAKVTYSVKVPDNVPDAKYATVTGSWGSISGESNWIENMIDNANNNRHLQPVENGRIDLEEDLFDIFFQDNNVTVYLPKLPTLTVRGGEYNLILWYENEDDKEPSWISWFVAISEPFRRENMVKTVSEIEDEEEVVLEPECISPSGTYDFETVRMPQCGLNNAYHVILSLYLNGIMCQPKSDMEFYLPYPTGCSYESKHIYTAYHYQDTYGSAEPILLVPTPHGLKLITSSLSPFVVTAGDGCAHQTTHEESDFEGETTVTDLHNGNHKICGTWVTKTVCDLCEETVGEPVTNEGYTVTETHHYEGDSNVCTVCSDDDILILPDDLKAIEANAFAGVSASVVVIPSSCESIAAGAFSGSNIKLVRFPDSEVSLNGNPFQGCTDLLLDGPDYVATFAEEYGYTMFGSAEAD